MANQKVKAVNSTNKKTPQEPPKIVYLIFLIGYGFVTVLTPNLKALDSNGPRFLSLALFNLATFLFLFTRKEFKFRPEWYFAFFRNGIGIAYVGLMIVSLLSFFKAINLLESVLHFSKIFTTFSGAYLVSILIIADKRNIRYLSVAMTLLLIYDSWTVFSEVINYIGGKRGSIFDITLGYSNKNILASSIFVKIPFALFLIFFNRQWMRALGMVGTFLAITATFFLSTRAFYVGTIALNITLLLYFGLRYNLTHDKFQLKLAGIYFSLVLFSFLIFSTTQRYLYPKAVAKALSVEARLATITDPSGGNRLEGWKRSWHVFKEDPILGVGLGNWKIATLPEENLTFQDGSVVQYKAHNDFIETATETGIFGGMLFLMLFLLTGWVFIRTLIRKPSTEWLTLLFLPSIGLFCYSVDAFFNFPQDRPEIAALFAIYLGMLIALISLFTDELTRDFLKSPGSQLLPLQSFRPLPEIPSFSNQIRKFINSFLQLPMIIVYGLFLTLTVYILFLNFNSLKLQNLVASDVKNAKLTHPASLFLNGFPIIPDLNVFSVPNDADKARYLINEQRNDEAIALLKKNKSNPFDDMSSLFISLAYHNQNNIDSSLAYIQKAYNLRPNKFKNVSNLCVLLHQKGRVKEVEIILNNYLEKIKNNADAWLFTFNFFNRTGDIQKAVSTIDSAAHYLPSNDRILKQKTVIKSGSNH